MKNISTGTRLRIAWLFFGMMFFFGIEQLFLNKVLKQPSARAFLTVAYVAGLVIFDVPTGILADRVSRKLCLLLAGGVQIISLVVLGISNSLQTYLIGSLIFGLFICLVNGAAQAILYDWLALTSRTSRYAIEQGRNYAAFLIGAGIANVASGFIANAISLRSTYFISIIPAVIAFLFLIKLEDPPVAKKQDALWYTHLGEVVKEASGHRKIIIYSLRLLASGVAFYTIGEFGQIYMLAFGVSTVALGIYWAIDAAFAASGRALAHALQDYPRLLILGFCLIIFLFSIVQKSYGIGLFWLFYGLNEAISNVAETEIQHETSSHIRATMLSVVSFVANVISIPIIFFYNHYYLKHGIFATNKIMVYGLIVLLVITLVVRSSKKTDQKASVPLSMPPAI
jgi:MFS family permease